MSILTAILLSTVISLVFLQHFAVNGNILNLTPFDPGSQCHALVDWDHVVFSTLILFFMDLGI